MPIDRRGLLIAGGAAALTAGMRGIARGQTPPDHTIRIGTGLVELGPDTTVSTKTYGGQFPGPLLRLKEGQRVSVDIHNDTDTAEQLHWHGQFLPTDVDGAAEEGTPFIPAHGMRRIDFVPGPAGFRFYHTHLTPGTDLSLGLYNGEAGIVYIEPKNEPGAFDREVFLTLKEFAPVFSRTEMPSDFLAPTTIIQALKDADDAAAKASAEKGMPQGFEVAYDLFSINGKMLGNGEPVRVKAGERVLFHVLNASATEIRSLALPGHVFKVVALDGNPVPNPAAVPVLWIGTAERVSAIVEMTHPGVWVLGDLDDEDRRRGMGIVVEYAGSTGKPAWVKPKPFRWDYRRFGKPGATAAPPDEAIDILIGDENAVLNGFNRFSINGYAFAMDREESRFHLRLGRRYRLRMRNGTDDVHPMHLHRHSFELTRIAGQPTAGVMKDVAMVGPFQEMEIDFTADQPGLSLFHCHMQLHMDFGLMALFETT